MKIMSEKTERAIDRIYKAVAFRPISLKEASHRREWPQLWSAIDELLSSVSPGGMVIRTDPSIPAGELHLVDPSSGKVLGKVTNLGQMIDVSS